MKPFRPSRGDMPGDGAAAPFRNLLLVLAALLALAQAAAADVRILAFGDSLTAGYGLPEGEGFVPQLQAWLRANGAPDATVINGGVSGDTSAGGLARIGWTLEDDVDGVLVELGANDMLRGLDVGEMRKNLDGILTEIDRRDLPALLAGLPAPPNYPADYRKAFKATFRDLAREHDAIYVSSFFGGMAEGRGVRQVMQLFQPDGLHPNAEGVTAIVEGIGPKVLELVERARARR
jgi:acyl-CoA thioesterase-1